MIAESSTVTTCADLQDVEASNRRSVTATTVHDGEMLRSRGPRMRYLPFVLALACCASRPIDCGYRPHVRTARDAEARDIDLSRRENPKIGDLNDYEVTTE